MRFNPGPLIRLVGSRIFPVVLIILSLAMTIVGGGDSALAVAPRSFFGFPSPGEWIAAPTLSLLVGIAAELLVVGGILLMVRAFNPMRGLRNAGMLMAGLFMMMQGAYPSTGRFTDGDILVLVALTAVIALYSIYQRTDGNRRIFLIFFLLALGSMVQYGFIPYIIVMILGCMQMRVMSLRAIVAILAGLLSPVWILWGVGILNFDELTLPTFINLFAPATFSQAILIAAATSVTIIAGASSGLMDMVQIYARNAMTRARFGLMAITGLATGTLAILDFGNIELYTPLLNLTTAYFLTLLFSLRQRSHTGAGTIVIAILTILFAVLYAWRILDALA